MSPSELVTGLLSSPSELVMSRSELVKRANPHRVGPDLMTSQQSLADLIEQTGHALTANELAAILGMSHQTIFRLAKAGRMPSFRIGTCVRFDPFTVARWLRQQ